LLPLNCGNSNSHALVPAQIPLLTGMGTLHSREASGSAKPPLSSFCPRSLCLLPPEMLQGSTAADGVFLGRLPDGCPLLEHLQHAGTVCVVTTPAHGGSPRPPFSIHPFPNSPVILCPCYVIPNTIFMQGKELMKLFLSFCFFFFLTQYQCLHN